MDIKEAKKYIKDCINIMELQEAYDLINQYKKLYGYDDEIASMEAIINIYNSNYEEALKCVRDGLKVNIFNSDLYFTMGNIYELREKFNNAYLCYEYALSIINNDDNKNVILSAIDNLKDKINVNKYSIIILTYNNLDYTKVCIDSIRKYNYNNSYEIIIVDNNSTDGTVEWLKQQEDIKYILNKENRGFPAGCNQGIDIAEKNNDIFLLNNDTVIMPNSIFNLRMGLYSDNNVGATGAVSNSVSYYQQISEVYDDFNDYMDYALKNNITNEESYEQRVKLVGFAMLIKRNVLNKVGLLDERFTPGNFEDDDLSLRIIMEGYKLLLCKDSYIHHFGSVSFKKDINKYNSLLKRNLEKFYEKWHNIERDFSRIEIELVESLNIDSSKSLKILNMGKEFIGTLLQIKNKFPNIDIYTVSNKKDSLLINEINRIKEININDKFDYIILNNFLENCSDIQEVFKYIKNLLKNDGKLILKVKNSMYYDNIIKIITGKFTNDDYNKIIKNNKYIFNFEEINKILNCNGFTNINIRGLLGNDNIFREEDKNILTCITNEFLKEQYAIKEYLIECKKDNIPMEKPLISICIPTYNRADCLEKCLKSIFSQIGDDERFQIVISNNASEDETNEIVLKYINNYGRIIKYNRNSENIGAHENFLKVMDIADGEYVLLHGDDDYFVNGSLYDIYNLVRKNNDKSCIFFNVLNNDKSVIGIENLDEFVKFIPGTCSVFISCIMLKKDYYMKVDNKMKYAEEGMNQTYILFEVLSKYGNGCILNESIFEYENNLDGNYSWPKIFIENYLKLLNEYVTIEKLSLNKYNFEKYRMMRYISVQWANIFKSLGKIEIYSMDDIFKMLDKYYKIEGYYEECYEIFMDILK